MLQDVVLKDHPEIKAVVTAAFPGYKKHKAWIRAIGPSGQGINSYWDGGSRAEYAMVDLVTGRRVALPTNTHPWYDIARAGLAGGEDSAVVVDHRGNVTLKYLPEGVALVQAGTFCGKPATAMVILNPANMAKLLGAGKGEQ